MNTETAAVAANPYQPPQAPVADVGIGADEGLYVVAPWKFLTLMIGTAGIYSLYWFYKNWSLLNRRAKAYWPVPRAIFSIFFTHALFEEVAVRVRRVAPGYWWSPRNLATVYVVCVLVSRLLQRLPSSAIPASVAIFADLVLLAPTIYVLYRAQLAINIAEGDEQGMRNSSFGAANIAWLIVGGIWWAMILLGSYLIMTGRVAPD
jgi:hypothetical protein